MSRASRLRDADKQFVPTRSSNGKFASKPVDLVKQPDPEPRRDPAGWQLARNAANIPGGVSARPMPEAFALFGQVWLPEDAGPHSSSIGYALAAEIVGAP